eukprot:881691-Pelagomonas_calceolata.AAC.3
MSFQGRTVGMIGNAAESMFMQRRLQTRLSQDLRWHLASRCRAFRDSLVYKSLITQSIFFATSA